MGPAGHSLAALAAAAAAPFALVGLALRPRWREGLPERLGRRPAVAPGAVWVHAASVGEAQAATSLLDALGELGAATVASTTTPTGRDLLRRLRPQVSTALAPLDHPWSVAAALARVRPAALALVETELWPAWIAAAHERGIPVVVVSGRISDRSFPRYRRLGRLLRGTLGRLAAVGARSAEDARRFVELGVPPGRVECTGDLKLDPPSAAVPVAPELMAALSIGPVLVAGSTHEGEEDAVLEALAAVEAAGHRPRLVLAPRRPERMETVHARVQAAGRRLRRRSALGAEPLAPGEVLLLDTLGELGGVYGLADAAFVGGSLVPVGGHNLLEPIHRGCPVLFGPHTEACTQAAALALATGAGRRVSDAAELGVAFTSWLADPGAARAGAARGVAALAAHRGAARRSAALVLRACAASGRARP